MSYPVEKPTTDGHQEGFLGNDNEDNNNSNNNNNDVRLEERMATMSSSSARPFIEPEVLSFSSAEFEERNENTFLQNYTLRQDSYNNNNGVGENFVSPSSTSSHQWRTPMLKVEGHGGWQETLEPSPVSHQDTQLSQPFQSDKRFLSTLGWQPEIDSYASDLDSDFGGVGSIYQTPDLRNQDAAVASPTVSYLTTGDEEFDDLLSVKSGNTGSSCILPVNDHGYKHVSNVDELDNLLTVINNQFDVDINGVVPSVTNDDMILERPDQQPELQQQRINPQSIQNPPVISIQEFPEQPIFNVDKNQYNLKGLDSSSSPEEILHLQRRGGCVQQHQPKNTLSCPTDTLSDASHEEMRGGRIEKRRASHGSRRSPRPSRSSSISPDEKARSLSEDSDRLLELADLQLPSPIPSRQSSTNSGGSRNTSNPPTNSNNFAKSGGKTMSALEEGETLQNLSGNTKKRLSQKNPAAFACELCGKKFTRPYNLKSHLRTHTNERPFECSICGKAFARQHDRKRHEDLHTGKKRYVCGGTLKDGSSWGCGKKFARSDALGRHFKTESGRRCIVPLYEEASREKGFIPDILQ